MNPLLPNFRGALLLACFFFGRVLTASAAPIDFDREIRPIFESRCVECHGAQKQKGGVRFDRKASVFKGGDSGNKCSL